MESRSHSRWLLFLFLLSLISLFFFPTTSYAATSWLKYSQKDSLLNPYMRAYAVHGDQLWVGTHGDGIVVYDGGNTKNFNSRNTITQADKKDGLLCDLVTCLTIDDHAGRVWVGTYEGLASCNLDGADWKRFTTKDGLPNDVVRDLAIDDKGSVWVGTPSGVACFDGETWKTFTSSNGLYEDSVRALTIENGAIWVATAGGAVCRFNGETWKTFLHN
ncbi:MAG: two-component regulator propeller domain-containing protein [Candidatus Ozemobacteraceae bacterium]